MMFKDPLLAVEMIDQLRGCQQSSASSNYFQNLYKRDLKRRIATIAAYTQRYLSTMAAVYKSLVKETQSDSRGDASNAVKKNNKQRVLMLSSRGVTYR